jgi:hypothetical protein
MPAPAGPTFPKKKKKKSEFDDEDEDEEKKNQSPLAVQVVTFIDGNFVSALMIVLTIVALWGDDVKDLFFSKNTDFLMDYFNLVAIVAVSSEFFGNAICKEGYKWGFFFWLDMIAAISLIPETRWAKAFFASLLQFAVVEDRASQAQSAGPSGKTVRSARLARLVRLVRLIRIVKLYSMVSKAKDSEDEERRKAQARAAQNAKQAALKRVEASRLGKVLSEMTTRRVLLGMLLMLLVLPFLSQPDTDNSRSFGLKLIFNFGVAAACEYDTTETEPSTFIINKENFAADALEDMHYQDSFFELPRPADYTPFCTDDQPWVSVEYWEAQVYLYSTLWKHSAKKRARAIRATDVPPHSGSAPGRHHQSHRVHPFTIWELVHARFALYGVPPFGRVSLARIRGRRCVPYSMGLHARKREQARM